MVGGRYPLNILTFFCKHYPCGISRFLSRVVLDYVLAFSIQFLLSIGSNLYLDV